MLEKSQCLVTTSSKGTIHTERRYQRMLMDSLLTLWFYIMVPDTKFSGAVTMPSLLMQSPFRTLQIWLEVTLLRYGTFSSSLVRYLVWSSYSSEPFSGLLKLIRVKERD